MAHREMIEPQLFSRPARLAARLRRDGGEASNYLFNKKHILVRIEEAFGEMADAQETFLFAVNQVLRFCPNVVVAVPRNARNLIDVSDQFAAQVHGPGNGVAVADIGAAPRFDAVINVGTEVRSGLPWITVNSTGWLARVASSGSEVAQLFWMSQPYNPIGALAAACLAAGSAFLTIAGHPVAELRELSLFTLGMGAPGSLSAGPVLPETPVELDGFLVGCGAVANGWAYAVKRLPIGGRLQGIDRQSLGIENLGSYVAAGYESVGRPKAEVIRDFLAPSIAVTARPDEWELFKIRLRREVPIPPLIVNGLDNVETRHSVQRLWPDTLIDMAADGLTSQVIVKHRVSDGLCLLGAFSPAADEHTWAERLAGQTGLAAERILNEPTSLITRDDVDMAPPEKRLELEHDHQQGLRVCGRVSRQNLTMEAANPDFAPAVPFVTGFSGVVGAAETVKSLMGRRYPGALHYQRSFQSGR